MKVGSFLRTRPQAFTLVELLVVMGIIGLLLGGLVLGLSGVLGSGNLTNSMNQISQSLDQARAYAMANNCYVLVGLTETAAGAPVNFNQAVATGNGTVLMEIVATKDGSNNVTTNGANPSNFVSVSKPLIFNNIHLVDLTGITGTTVAKMNRPALAATTANLSATYASNSVATPTGNWPFGSFSGLFIQFDSQGTAATVTSFPTTGPVVVNPVVPFMELGFQESHGTAVSALGTDLNYAALQIEGITGNNQTYRP